MFGVLDYIIFAITLSLSAAIGIYFGCFGKKQKSATEYLYGSGNIKAIPIGLSLYASAISAVTILGTPPEVYVFGSQFMLVTLGAMMSLFISWNLIMPVFCSNIKIKTPYEYFELRYSTKVRVLSSFIYILNTLIYMPIVLYASTLAFSEATGIHLIVCTSVVGGVCVLYTMLGGFSSVIWTDTLQASLMIFSCLFVMVMGISKVGGLAEVWKRAEEGGRIKFFDTDPNPLKRMTLWTATIGMFFNYAAHSGTAASTIQRYMALENEKQARVSTFIGACGMAIITAITGMMGLSMYALYHKCDPIKNGDIGNANQLVPHFITDTVGDIPGFSGFFIAGLMSAGLSTISAELNTVGGLVLHDFIQKMSKQQINETKGAFIMKTVVLFNGIFYLVAAPLSQNTTHLFQLSLTLIGITYGAKLGLMLLGTSFPKSNSNGAIWGMIVSVSFIGWLSFNAMNYKPDVLPVSISHCQKVFTQSNSTSSPSLDMGEPFFLFKLSYMYYTLLGTLITVVVGMAVSYATGPNDVHKIDPCLLIPCLRTRIESQYCMTQNTPCEDPVPFAVD